jgi:hypothetical protein
MVLAPHGEPFNTGKQRPIEAEPEDQTINEVILSLAIQLSR